MFKDFVPSIKYIKDCNLQLQYNLQKKLVSVKIKEKKKKKKKSAHKKFNYKIKEPIFFIYIV